MGTDADTQLWTILRWYRYYKTFGSGAKSVDQFFRHVKDVRDARRRIAELERKSAKVQKERTRPELRHAINQQEDAVQRHLKEMRQKWPEFMRDREL
jgi:predicted  nucleic acid-binding Zn-ribbon protein